MKNEVARYEIEDDNDYDTLTFAGTECEIHTTDDTTLVSKAAGMKALRAMRKYAKEYGLTVRETRWEQDGDWRMQRWD
jgi:hypothetical protein